MDIEIFPEQSCVVVKVNGRLITINSPELEAKLEEVYDLSNNIVFDFGDLEYISSAGLRVLMAAFKRTHAAGGSIAVRNANDYVIETFEITGFTDFLDMQ